MSNAIAAIYNRLRTGTAPWKAEGMMLSRNARAFTIVEIVVVVGIIGVLVSLLVPTLASFRAESDSTVCLSNVRQLMLAVEAYRQQSDGIMPPTEALPLATPDGPMGGLPDALKGFIKLDSPVHLCPRDHQHEWHGLGTSYMYLPGAAMLLVPIQPSLSFEQNKANAARYVTNQYEAEFANVFPVIYDSEDRHMNSPRTPRNAAFLDGSVRKWGDQGAQDEE